MNTLDFARSLRAFLECVVDGVHGSFSEGLREDLTWPEESMFGSLVGGAGAQLQKALQIIAQAQRGVILYLRQREHNLDLAHQLKTYALMQERGLDWEEARRATGYGARRDYGIGAQILHDIGLHRITLLTDKPPRVTALEGFALELVGHIPLGN